MTPPSLFCLYTFFPDLGELAMIVHPQPLFPSTVSPRMSVSPPGSPTKPNWPQWNFAQRPDQLLHPNKPIITVRYWHQAGWSTGELFHAMLGGWASRDPSAVPSFNGLALANDSNLHPDFRVHPSRGNRHKTYMWCTHLTASTVERLGTIILSCGLLCLDTQTRVSSRCHWMKFS